MAEHLPSSRSFTCFPGCQSARGHCRLVIIKLAPPIAAHLLERGFLLGLVSRKVFTPYLEVVQGLFGGKVRMSAIQGQIGGK